MKVAKTEKLKQKFREVHRSAAKKTWDALSKDYSTPSIVVTKINAKPRKLKVIWAIENTQGDLLTEYGLDVEKSLLTF